MLGSTGSTPFPFRFGSVAGVACATLCLTFLGCGQSRSVAGSDGEREEQGEREETPTAEEEPVAPTLEVPQDILLPVPEPDARLYPSGVQTSDLSELLPQGAELVGVTVEPGTGDVFVLDRNSGLYRLTDDSAEHVFDLLDMADLESNAGEESPEPGSAFTDVAALGQGRFALTAKNEGFLLDIEARKMDLHFCYLPPFEPGAPSSPESISEGLSEAGIAHYQITESLAYSSSLGVLYAQPLTIDSETEEVYGSELGLFDAITGQALSWFDLGDSTIFAGGMAADDEQVLFLGIGVELFTFTGFEGLLWRGDLAPYGVGIIEGMAWDRDSGDLLLVEAERPLLHRVELSTDPR